MRKRASKETASKERAPVRTLAILLLAIIVLSFFVGIAFWKWYVFNVKEVPIEVSVTDSALLGFNAGTDKLYFGTLASEGYGDRKTLVVSAYDSTVVFKMRGTAGDWVTVSDNYVHLLPNGHRDVIFRLTIPAGTPPGNYTGTAIIEYHRRMFWE